MKEHKYAHVLRWIADGEEVEGRPVDCDAHWKKVTKFGMAQFSLAFQDQDDEYEFRIKPKTVKIGNVECEAPLNHISINSTYHIVSTSGHHEECISDNSQFDRNIASLGRAFATKEAALAAHEAITALLTGNP